MSYLSQSVYSDNKIFNRNLGKQYEAKRNKFNLETTTFIITTLNYGDTHIYELLIGRNIATNVFDNVKIQKQEGSRKKTNRSSIRARASLERES